MLCDDSWLNEDGFAHPSLAIITSGTNLGYLSSLPMIADDEDDMFGPISCPPIPKVVHALDGHRNMKRFAHHCIDAYV